MPKPCETAARKLPKRCFWNLLKTKKKTCKLPGQTQEKGVWDARAKKQNPSRFCAQAIAKPQPEKCRNVAVGTH